MFLGLFALYIHAVTEHQATSLSVRFEVPQRLTGKTKLRTRDIWNNPTVKDPLELEPFPFALRGSLLQRHLASVPRG